MKSKPYQIHGKLFRYDFDDGTVEYISEASEESIADEQEWIKEYGRPLFEIDQEGYIVLETAGLSPEHWKNKAARDEYLSVWADELDEELAALEKQYELYG